MIVRLVKMEFQAEYVSDFKKLFEDKKEKIRAFPGCQYLELMQGLDAKETVFYTYSYWDTEKDLENYRYSDLFKNTWAATKSMFAQKAEAISLHKLHTLV